MRLKLPTLKYRRLRGDMIGVFKITHNILYTKLYLKSNIRGNEYKLFNHTFTMIHENILLLPVLLIFGIACLILLLMLILFVCSKHV